jgi:hypothetical protein
MKGSGRGLITITIQTFYERTEESQGKDELR